MKIGDVVKVTEHSKMFAGMLGEVLHTQEAGQQVLVGIPIRRDVVLHQDYLIPVKKQDVVMNKADVMCRETVDSLVLSLAEGIQAVRLSMSGTIHPAVAEPLLRAWIVTATGAIEKYSREAELCE